MKKHEMDFEKYKGRRGGPEGETVIVVNNSNDYISVWSDRGVDIVALGKRCSDDMEVYEKGGGVTFHFPFECFRTPAHCFKTGKRKKK